MYVLEVVGYEVDLPDEGAQLVHRGGEFLVDDGFNVRFGVGNEVVGYLVTKEGGGGGGPYTLVFVEVYVVFSAGSEDLFDVFHVCWEAFGVNQ